jgi:cytochrome c-type biogenesis protein CcmH
MRARTLAGEPTRLLDRALASNPRHPKGLLLAGTAAFERGDHAAAANHWEGIDERALGDSPVAQQLREHVAEARRRAGLAPAAAASAAASANDGARVRGRIALDPALAAAAAPDDTLFVVARAASGPRQPLAVLRRQVRDLPLDFALGDADAMSPQFRLSQVERVVIAARISRSGDALPRAGDLVGQSAPVAPGTSSVQVQIAETVRGTP